MTRTTTIAVPEQYTEIVSMFCQEVKAWEQDVDWEDGKFFITVTVPKGMTAAGLRASINMLCRERAKRVEIANAI